MRSHDQPASNIASLSATGVHADLPQLPHIPTELLLLIIDHVAAEHILPFRAVCRSIKEHIDNFISKAYLQRMTIIGYEPLFEPSARFQGLCEEIAKALPFVNFNYSHLADTSRNSAIPEGRAVFNIDPRWLAMYKPWLDSTRLLESKKNKSLYLLEHTLEPVEEWKGPTISDDPTWFICLDNIALMLDLGTTKSEDSDGCCYTWSLEHFYLDHKAMTVTVDWRLVLRNMLVEEAEISRRVRAHAHKGDNGDFADEESKAADQSLVSKFTYGPLEDHIRAVHREYTSRYYDVRGPEYEEEVWHPLNRHKGLFGQPRKVAEVAEGSQFLEDRLMTGIMKLRKGVDLGHCH